MHKGIVHNIDAGRVINHSNKRSGQKKIIIQKKEGGIEEPLYSPWQIVWHPPRWTSS